MYIDICKKGKTFFTYPEQADLDVGMVEAGQRSGLALYMYIAIEGVGWEGSAMSRLRAV